MTRPSPSPLSPKAEVQAAAKFPALLSTVASAALIGFVITGCAPAAPDTTGTDNSMDDISNDVVDTSSAAAADSSSTDGAMQESAYVDGTYDATGNYVSPAGQEEVAVTLTLKDDVITDAEFVGKGQHPTTMTMQGKFAEGYKAEVVGKPIDSLSLTVVNGSSLAPKGFMDAVEQIKIEASA